MTRTCTTSALLLLMALLLAAGCVSQIFPDQTLSSPEGKYVFLEHQINVTSVTKSGSCHSMNACFAGPSSQYILEEQKGVLSVTGYRDQKETVNGSLILFYGRDYFSDKNPCDRGKTGLFVYSLPAQFNNITVESVMENGTVTLRHDDVPIVLKPKERWENSTREMRITESISMGEEALPGCTEDITTREIIYHAGVFDKRAIIISK